MSPQTPITKDLLFAYFAGRATALQKQTVEQWLKEPSNEEFFYTCLHEWETRHLEYRADVEEAIGKFHLRLEEQPVSLVHHINKHSTYSSKAGATWKRWLAAASVVLILGTCSWYFQEHLLYKNYTTAYGETSNITLPDNSQVVLNANSSLRIPRFGFGKKSRQVFLQGEANFSVVHTPDDMKFIVQTDSLFKVEVLGTEFTVFARERQTKVVLSKGKVKVAYGTAETVPPVEMVPGELVAVNKAQKKLEVKKVKHPENYASWRDNRFIFEHTSLIEVKHMLEENYGLVVEISNKQLASKTISGSFQAQSANELLQAISEVLQINVIRHNEHVTFIDNK